MRAKMRVILGILIAVGFGSSAAQQKSSCSLLSSSDIGAVVSATVGEPHDAPMLVPEGPARGETFRPCMWKVGDQGMVTVGVFRAFKGAEREAGLAKINATLEALKAKGWTKESENSANTWCSLMIPPASEKKSPAMTSCMAEAKGMGISVVFTSGNQRLEIAKVKVLLDKAVERLP